MSKRQPRLLIEDIIDSGNKILDYTKSLTFDEFIGDSKTVDAVVRNFEIIGEAANRLPEEFKASTPISTGIELRASETVSFTITSVLTLQLFGKSKNHFFQIFSKNYKQSLFSLE